jgi:hypothetical protein
MVANTEWGPPLWRILHTLTERIGGQTHPLLATDEERRWGQLLATLEDVMPCQLCRKHYRERKKTLSLEGWHGVPLREESRRWLWTLHEAVNKERGVTSGITLEDLKGVYGARTRDELQADVAALFSTLQKAMQIGLASGDRVRAWKGILAQLRPLVGL